MLTYTYISKGNFGLIEKPKPTIHHERDAIVKVTLASICSSDLHIKHGSVPRAVEGITDVHDMFGMVLQDTWLFEGTVRENLAYNMTEITDEDIMRVAKVCGIDKFIRSLPQGLDTVLTEGTTISAGQKQLLIIARAMLQDAPMLILDEATSSVDTRTEVIIQRAMDELTKGRTSFVIAHRLSTIRNADLILVMKDGDVIESGDHEELMQKGGFYYQLYQSQFDVKETQKIFDIFLDERIYDEFFCRQTKKESIYYSYFHCSRNGITYRSVRNLPWRLLQSGQRGNRCIPTTRYRVEERTKRKHCF